MRYLPLSPDDRTAMLAAIGAKSIDDLFVDVPAEARRDGLVDLPRVAGELEVERALSAMAAKKHSGRNGGLLLWGWGLSPPCAGDGRSHHPAV
jgi:glycine cleavage system pyridoxal-binding protein P